MNASSAAAEPVVQDIYPLSPLQRGLLFESALGGRASGMYFVQSRFRLSGRFDLPHFIATLEETMGRHQALRTAFSTDLAAPLQIVYAGLHPVLRFEDLREHSRESQIEHITRWSAQDAAAGFDLEDPPLWRCAVFMLAETEHVILFSFHHIIMDGTSFAVLFGELMRGYRNRVRDRVATIAPAAQFRDYIAWLGRQKSAESETYWRQKLADVDQPTLLRIESKPAPTDESEPASPGTLRLELSAELSERLRAFARTQRLTLNTLLQGAFGLVLSRCVQCERVCFGVSVSTRPPELPRADSIVGLMINTVPCVIDAPDTADRDQWLQAVQMSGNEILQHSHGSLPQLSTFTKIPAGQPMFNTLYVLEGTVEMTGAGAEADDTDSLVVSADEGYREQTEFALALAIVPASSLRLQLMFDPRALDETSVREFADGYVYVLEQMIDQSSRDLGTINVVRPHDSWTTSWLDARTVEVPEGRPQSTFDDTATLVLPRTATELALARIWSEVLGRAEIGVDEDFFAAGGSSMGAMRVVTLAQQQNFDVSLQMFIRLRTIRTLAARMDTVAQLQRASASVDRTVDTQAVTDASMETGVI